MKNRLSTCLTLLLAFGGCAICVMPVAHASATEILAVETSATDSDASDPVSAPSEGNLSNPDSSLLDINSRHDTIADADRFLEPDNGIFFFCENALADNSQRATLFSGTVDEVIEEITTSYSTYLTLEQQADYGNEALYILTDNSDQMIAYLSLIRRKDDEVLLVLWRENPSDQPLPCTAADEESEASASY